MQENARLANKVRKHSARKVTEMVSLALILGFLGPAGCVQTAKDLRNSDSAGRASFGINLSVNDAYSIIQSNATHCWADAANYIIAGAPLSPSRPPFIQINSTAGHLMAIVDFSSVEKKTKVEVRVGYAIKNESRTKDWQRALELWLTGSDSGYCPTMP